MNYLSVNNNEKDIEEEEEIIKDEKTLREEENKAKDIFIENVNKGLTNGNYDTNNIDTGKNDIIQYKDITITIATTESQKNEKGDNMNLTTINLVECEELLRKAYNIHIEDKLYMKKTDVFLEGMKVPKIEYEVYRKLEDNKLEKLNLSYCKNSKVALSIPVIINEELDKLNSSSGYYNDICYTATTESGTDIILKDRKTEFVLQNKTVCQESCIFSEYNYETKKAKCSCDVKESSSSFANININTTKLYDNFVNIENIGNFNLLACYNRLFSDKGIIQNYGSYSLIVIILGHFILIILFYSKKSYDTINKKIKNITFALSNWKLVVEERKRIKILEIIKKEEEEKKRKEKLETKKNKNNKKDIKILPPLYNSYKQFIPKEEQIENINPLPPLYYAYKKFIPKKDQKDFNNPPKRNILFMNINKKKNYNNIISNNKNNKFSKSINLSKKRNNIISGNIDKRNRTLLTISPDQQKKLDKTKKIMEYNDRELNELSFELALKYDNRTFCQYYLSLIRTKHDLFFTFFNNNDYNIKIIKIDLFLFGFSLYYVVNALFFNDNTMHKIYEDKGSFNFIYQLPQIIYSSIISALIKAILKILALSEGAILEYKSLKKKEKLSEKEKTLYENLKIKFVLYFIISTLFLLFFWYYLAMFCAIYVKTQIHLIKDTFISFGLSQFYPLFIYLVPGICRIPSLSNPNKKRNIMYRVSQIVQMV